MEPKKNPKADVGRNSGLYFTIGLALMLFLTLYAINHKTYDKSNIDIGQLNLDEELEEEVPITEQLQTPPPPPPPPPAAPEVIEVVEDEEEVEETVIQSTETSQEEEIAEVEDVEVEEEEEDIEVPFAVIENVPVFPGCEGGSNEDKKACMNKKMQEFVQKKFNTELASELGLSGIQKINVFFKIDKNGNIVDIKSRAPHPRLEKEAERVVSLLPKMVPGKQRGKAVRVPYYLPIKFQVQ
ncbi:MAG: energy transducer TonB [Flavobacteriaceae bacterium]|nr:energy transducer TonB [Mangrovimonas sp.]MCB0433458.1 energy transducer TonB [Mangrovimonas sp.]MCB0438730.1 energy transducer TonB [Mangrovimonas sp.]HPF97465.1 energy transducer TonB [Mangrovimonas sp.]HRV54713.1 energy transducer TonB [Mangrovimonas sp.]